MKPGMQEKGKRIIGTREEWEYLAGIYEKQLIESKEEISRLKQRINTLEQKPS